jgi:acyl-[acyl-carrier-protein]-phospholipid O-acyltransferase/long-chain-fatty-acid--[acyl-carrier-protein] ligase
MNQDAPSTDPTNSQCVTTAEPQHGEQSEDNDSQPGLFHDKSFWGLMMTQFLGAFNDNLYKQLMLLLALPAALTAGVAMIDSNTQPATVVAQQSDETNSPNNSASNSPSASVENVQDQKSNTETVPSVTDQELKSSSEDVQGWAGLVFALPFVLFSGFAGFLSDRFKKTPIIVLAKYAEILVMFLGMLGFLYYTQLGELGTWTVLFLMGTQSAFFGPGKYGLLPELFRAKDLARANGLMLMTTFLAIILGIVAAGILKERLDPQQLWIGSLICIGIAVVGTATSHLIRHTPPANPHVCLTADCWGVSKEMIQLFRVDRPLLMAILVSSLFWLVSGLAVPVVNRLGMEQLNVGETKTSILTACIALGIMIGALAASLICRSRWGKYAVNIGLSGIFVSLMVLGMWTGDQQLLGFSGSLVFLMLLGIFAAIFSIPVQVFLQVRPPKQLKGRLIATMNQANFLGILLAGPLYQVFERISAAFGWPISSVCWMMAAFLLPLAFYYRLDSRTSVSAQATANVV